MQPLRKIRTDCLYFAIKLVTSDLLSVAYKYSSLQKIKKRRRPPLSSAHEKDTSICTCAASESIYSPQDADLCNGWEGKREWPQPLLPTSPKKIRSCGRCACEGRRWAGEKMRRIKAEAAWAKEVRRRHRKQRGESSASISPTEMESYYRYSLSCQRLHSEWRKSDGMTYW